MKKFIYIMMLAIGALISMNVQAVEKAAQIQTQQTEGIWIDVRSPEEFNQGHLTNALNIPLKQINEKIAAVASDKSAPINLYCRSGRRAAAAMDELIKLGYTNVTNRGGYQELVAQGYK